jgi:RimJ/RimL family protein N-acetyltransferase
MDLAGIELRTERLLLRRCREDDLDRLAEMQALPEVARYLYWEPAPGRRSPRRWRGGSRRPGWSATTTGSSSPSSAKRTACSSAT